MITESLNGEKLALGGCDNLRVCFLGVGSAFASRNLQTSFLLMQGDHHVLVDFGMTGPQALREVAGRTGCTRRPWQIRKRVDRR